MQYLYPHSSGLIIMVAIYQHFLYTWGKTTTFHWNEKPTSAMTEHVSSWFCNPGSWVYHSIWFSNYYCWQMELGFGLGFFFPDRCDHSMHFCFMSLSTLWKGTPVPWCCCYKIYLSLKSYSQYQNKLHGINMIFNFK